MTTIVANPMSGHAQYAGARTSWGINGELVRCSPFTLIAADTCLRVWLSSALGTLVVEVEADDGHVGVGVTTGGEPAAYIVENHLRCEFLPWSSPHSGGACGRRTLAAAALGRANTHFAPVGSSKVKTPEMWN